MRKIARSAGQWASCSEMEGGRMKWNGGQIRMDILKLLELK
jgi:hypothetical protein